MAVWYYKGRAPTPVQIPGRGSVVLTPKCRFSAPAASVAHLLKVGMVTKLSEDPSPDALIEVLASIPAAPVAVRAPEAVQETTVRVNQDPTDGSDVVGSDPSTPVDAEAVATSDSAQSAEEEEKNRPRSRRGGRR